MANKAPKVSQLFDDYAGNDIVRVACRALDLKQTEKTVAGSNHIGR